MNRGVRSTPSAIAPEEIRRHLTKILSSPTFSETDRLRSLLRWLVNEVLDGRNDIIKEALVGIAVFNRPPNWDPQTDAIVRVQVRNLRLYLARYYEQEGAQDLVRIHIPKGGYHPAFERWASPAIHQRLPRWAMVLTASLLAALLLLVGWLWVHRGLLASRPVAVLTFRNLSHDPSHNLLAAGLTEEVVALLAATPGIDARILPHTQTAGKGSSNGCPAMARYHLSGSLEPAAGKPGIGWLVTARLTNCRTGAAVWVRQYERPTAELESLPPLIVGEVVKAVR